MPYIESSAVSFIYYDEVAAELHVEFSSGRAYVYYGVPRQVYDALRVASSAGAFFNTHIRNKYRYRRSISPLAMNRPVSSRSRAAQNSPRRKT